MPLAAYDDADARLCRVLVSPVRIVNDSGMHEDEVTKFFEDAVDCASDFSLPHYPSVPSMRRVSNSSLDSQMSEPRPADPSPTPFSVDDYFQPINQPLSFPDSLDEDARMLEWRDSKWRDVLSARRPLELRRIPWPVFFFEDFELEDDDATRVQIINFVYALASTLDRRLEALKRELERWRASEFECVVVRVRPEERMECIARAEKVYHLLEEILVQEKWHTAFQE